MMRFRGRMLAAPVAVVLLALVSGCNQSGGSGGGGGMPGMGGPQTPPKVGFLALHPSSVPVTQTLPGRTVASAVAEIRPQVSGIVQKRVFREGTEVKTGDVLYQIDDRSYRAAVDSAKADVDKADAAIPNAQAKLSRYQELADAKGVSRQDIDDARAALLQAKATAASARAALQTAQINLDYTKVTAPISGPIGTSSVTEGALVTASQATALATIRQIDPIYVDMTVSTTSILNLRKLVDRSAMSSGDGAKVTLMLDDGTSYPVAGKLVSTEANVDEGTSSVTLRASFPNTDHLLLPGMYVRATVALGVDQDAFLVPQRAVGRDTKGRATAVFLTSDNKVETRLINADRAYGNFWVVRQGIADGDRLVVDGTLSLRAPGQAVTPVAVELDQNGLVKDAAAAGQPGAAKPAQ